MGRLTLVLTLPFLGSASFAQSPGQSDEITVLTRTFAHAEVLRA